MTDGNLRLQPWRYLHEVARQLIGQGHAVTILSDGRTPGVSGDDVAGVPIRRVASISSPRWRGNMQIQAALQDLRPDMILWHVGVLSFVWQEPKGWPSVPVVGIFTSPIYRPREIVRPGLGPLLKGYRLSSVHILSTIMPRQILPMAMRKGIMQHLVVQTATTGGRLTEAGIRAEQIHIIPPGTDPIWHSASGEEAREIRSQLGYTADDTVVVYFGSPARLRGLHSLVQGMGLALRADPSLKLLILSRRHENELFREDRALSQLVSDPAFRSSVKVVSGFLAEDTLIRHIAACDIVALPFELISSDAPLSLLEARALGKPIVTTALGCLPELVAGGIGYFAQPADPVSLAQALQHASADFRSRSDASQPIQDSSSPGQGVRSWQQMGEEWSTFIQGL